MLVAGWNKFIYSSAPIFCQGFVLLPDQVSCKLMPEETVSVYHSLKPMWDADTKNHYLMVLSVCQLFSSKDEEQVETYHGFYARASTQIGSVVQSTVGTKSLLADGVLSPLIMNSSCIGGWHFPFSASPHFFSFLMCLQSALKTPGVHQRTPASDGFSRRSNSKAIMLTFEGRNNL